MGKLTEAQYQEIFGAYAADTSIAELARRFDVAEQTIWKALKRRGLLVRRLRSNPSLSEEQVRRAADLYRSGLSGADIAKVLERSTACIYKYLRDVGVSVSKSEGKLRRIPQEVRDRIVELYASDQSLDEIAASLGSLGVTKRIAVLELRRRGVARRPANSRGRFHREPETRQDISERYLQGMSVHWLADIYDCSSDAIKKVLRDANIQVRSFDEATGLKWTDAGGRVFYMRSMWEIRTAVWLDQQKKQWDYEKESFDIGGRTYTPDFWIYDGVGQIEQIVDVKGWLRPESADAIQRFQKAFTAIPFELWDEVKLRTLGILDLIVVGDVIASPSYPVCVSKVTDAEKSKIAAIYSSGSNIEQTAKATGRSHTIIEQVIAGRGIVRDKAVSNRMRVPQAVRDQIATLYSAGDSITVVAEKTGVGRDIVHGEIKRRGISRSRSDAQSAAYSSGRGRWNGGR